MARTGDRSPVASTIVSKSDQGSTAPSTNIKGAAWMTLAMFGYVVNDTFIKVVAEDLPLFHAIFIRGLLITAIIAIVVVLRGEARYVSKMTDRSLMLRVFTEALGTAVYLTALTKLPLASLTAVIQIVPIAVTFAAARLFREPLSIHRIGTVIIGFLGVLLIVRPWSTDFSPWFLLGLVAVGLIVVRELATRNIDTDIPSLVVALGTAVTITAMGLGVSLVNGWGTVDRPQLILLGLAAFFLTIGYLSSVITIRVGELSFSAPFRYTVLIFAIALQIVVFQDVPDAATFAGIAIIVVAGLWAFAHERVLNVFVRSGTTSSRRSS